MTKAKSSWFWKCDIGLPADSARLLPPVEHLGCVAGFYPHLTNGLKGLVTSRVEDPFQTAGLGSESSPRGSRWSLIGCSSASKCQAPCPAFSLSRLLAGYLCTFYLLHGKSGAETGVMVPKKLPETLEALSPDSARACSSLCRDSLLLPILLAPAQPP